MNDLISRQMAIEAVSDCGICIQRIVDLPSAQPEQQWIPCSETVDIPDYMVYISFEEAKEILKKSIDETTNINEALEKTVQSIYLKGYENGSRRLWTSTTIPPKVSGKYLVTHGGNYILSLDTYTTMEDAVRIFDDGYENYIGWQSQNVIAYMPLPKPYKEDDHD